MAIVPLHSESAQEKPLDTREVLNRIDALEERADQIAALIYTVSRDGELDPEVCTALRAIGKMAAEVGCGLIDLREKIAG